MKSIRAYLAAILVSTICIVNFVAALNGYRNSTQLADQALDARLSDTANLIARLSLDDASNIVLNNDAIVQLWVSGALQHASINAPQEQLTEFKTGMHLVNRQGIQWRVYVTQAATERWVIYGERYDSYRKLIDSLVVGSILPIVWVLPLIALLIWLIIAVGLRPLRRLTESLLRRGENDLGAVLLDNYPAELLPVVKSVNSLFARLEQALKRERRFSANAAHELRTPIAVLKVSLHNHIKMLEELSQNESNGQLNTKKASLVDLQDGVARMEKSIEQILALHQLTPENVRRTMKPCDLVGLTQEVILGVYRSIQEKGIDVELKGDSFELTADPNALCVLIKNLLENAIKYTPENGAILLSTKIDEKNNALLIIEDSGPGIPASSYQKVFDRFYRVAQDNSDSRVTGSGLGLSIVKHILDLHDGAVSLSKSTELGGLRVEVRLPANSVDNKAANELTSSKNYDSGEQDD